MSRISATICLLLLGVLGASSINLPTNQPTRFHLTAWDYLPLLQLSRYGIEAFLRRRRTVSRRDESEHGRRLMRLRSTERWNWAAGSAAWWCLDNRMRLDSGLHWPQCRELTSRRTCLLLTCNRKINYHCNHQKITTAFFFGGGGRDRLCWWIEISVYFCEAYVN